MTDDDLLALFDARDEAAIEQTAAKYGERLTRLSLRLLSDDGAAEECVNDTYLKAWRAIPPAKPAHLAAYLSQIARHTAFEMLEKSGAQKRAATLVSITDEMAACLPDRWQVSPPSEVEYKEWVNAFLAILSDDARRIFLRRYFFADSVSDIAKRYRISESKVKTTLHRTRQKLRTFLEEEAIAL